MTHTCDRPQRVAMTARNNKIIHYEGIVMRVEPPSSFPPPPRRPQSPSLQGLSGPELDAQLRKRIEQRIEDRTGFIFDLIAFVGIVPVLWLIWVSAGPPDIVWPLFVTLPWLVGLIIHGMVVYQGSARATVRREQKIRREMELEKQRLGITDDSYEKPKRNQHMRLSDDGELVPVDDEFETEAVKLKHDAR